MASAKPKVSALNCGIGGTSAGEGCKIQKLLRHIFYDPGSGNIECPLSIPQELDHMDSYLDLILQYSIEQHKLQNEEAHNLTGIGRLGPENVLLDVSGNSGILMIEPDRLGVVCHSNFGTIRANTCVFQGKWVYEIMLGSKGVMQLGWCTLNCKFSQEEGVGDTDDSYAYDGSRIRKWNAKSPLLYGKAWLIGDVISCAIDCDNGVVTFYRNGESMGPAFTKVRLGPGKAYFPAVSLSLSENIRVNFGDTPLRYPLDGYRPLQDPPVISLVKARCLLDYMDRLVPLLVDDQRTTSLTAHQPTEKSLTLANAEMRSKKATLMIISAYVMDKLAPLLKSPYIVESCLLEFLLQNCDARDLTGEQPLIHKTLDLLWALLQEQELKACLDHLMMGLLSAYRFSPATRDFAYQQTFLVLTHTILKNERTRKYLLKYVLFDKIKFAVFLHVKPPDDQALADLIPNVWWGFARKERVKDGDQEKKPTVDTPDEAMRKKTYLDSCEELHKKVRLLEHLQIDIVKLLLINDDNKEGGASSRFVFLNKFREFLKENAVTGTRAHTTNQSPLPVILCFFHRLISAVRHYWDEYCAAHPDSAIHSDVAFVPCKIFYDESVNFFEIQRLGGLASHLKKTYKEELQKAHVSVEMKADDEDITFHRGQIVYYDSLVDVQRKMLRDEPEGRESASCRSLVELLDGIIMMYNMAAHKQLSKMCIIKDALSDYVTALEDTRRKIQECPPELPEVKAELTRTCTVFEQKVTEQTRHMAWVRAVIYSQDKQGDVYWLLQGVLRTLHNAATQGPFFAFVPDYYVNACIHLYNALRSYFYPIQSYTDLPGFPMVLQEYAKFLGEHFADSRVVSAECKDSLVQALAGFVCYPQSLQALESLPEESRLTVVKTLLAPYGNRSWAQTNWILARLWKGCGFAFRYKHLPNLTMAKNQLLDIENASLQKPCPSLVFQQHIKHVMLKDTELGTKLIDSILNQLNWAFSEFIGMLQELQSIAARPTAAIVDSHQLQICATCFDISVGLLRVLEMTVDLVPELLTDWSLPSAELLLCRLYQLISQVLNRVTSRSNTFDMVVGSEIPGLETVSHFPILTAVAGILIRIVSRTSGKPQECATAALLAEPGFQLDSLEFLLGAPQGEASAAPPTGKKTFSLQEFSEVSEEEVEQINALITHLRREQNETANTLLEIDEDSLCSICYARPNSVRFVPCGHKSCRSCIAHHLMNKKDCFFCKAQVETVVDTQFGPST